MKKWKDFKNNFWKMYNELTVEQLIDKRKKKMYASLSLVASTLLIVILWVKTVFDVSTTLPMVYQAVQDIMLAVLIVVGVGTIIVLLFAILLISMAINLSATADFLDLMVYLKKVFR